MTAEPVWASETLPFTLIDVVGESTSAEIFNECKKLTDSTVIVRSKEGVRSLSEQVDGD